MSRIWWPYAWTTADRQSKHGISRVLHPGPDGLELISRGKFEEGAELARAGGVPQLVQGLDFDLADTFAGEGERLAHFLERVLAAVFQPEAHLDDLFLAWGERLQYLRGLLLQVQIDDRV